MNRALEDGRYAYTIGFYPDHDKWDGKYRKITIQTKSAGVKLRYRTGYFAEAEGADSDEAKSKLAMQQAALSPLDATGLGMIVDGKPAGAPGERKIELHVGLDPKQLLLQVAEDHRKGAVDLYFVQRDGKGDTVAAESLRIGLKLEEKQYEYLAKAGIVLARHLIIAPEATEVRVLVRDPASDTLGSVTIPVQALLEGLEGSVTPAKVESPK